MSRCFPYVRNGAIVEALIEPIKLQRGRTEIKEKAKTEIKKEKKREKSEIKKEKKRKKAEIKKEKRGEKKEERKQQKVKEDGGISDGKIIKFDDDKCDGYPQKRIEDEFEQLEKSGLTEEHEQPVCSPKHSYLSDSTQSSNKRKRDTPPSNHITRHRESGTILRVRLPLKRQREPDDTSLGKEQLCSTSGRTDSLAQQKKEIVHVQPPLKRQREPDTSLGKEQLGSASGRADSLAQQKKEIVPVQLPLKKQRVPDTLLSKEQLRSASGRADSLAQQKKEIVPVQLPLKKQREPDTLLSKEQLRSTSGRADSVAQLKKEIIRGQPPLKKQRDTDSSLGKEQLCSTSGRADSVTQLKKEIVRIQPPLKNQRDTDTLLGKEQSCSTSGRADSVTQLKKEIVRIQPPLKKQKDTDTLLGKEQLCSTSGRADSVAQLKKEIVRVQLPLKKQRDTDSSLGKEQLCSTSVRADCVAQQKEIVHVPSQEQCLSTKSTINILAQGLTSRPEKESTRSVPERIETSAQGSARTAIGRTSYKQRTESLCKALIENLVPPPIEYVANDSDEEDWLFRPKQQDTDGSKRYKASDDVPCFKSPTTLFPRAHYLSEVDVYALPYMVPF